jgi:hypothetical protein
LKIHATVREAPTAFKLQEAFRTMVAFNKHKGHSRQQWGGSFSMVYGSLATAVADRGKGES